MQALDHDGWACVVCGTHKRLEVDHIQPVRTHPELANDLDNLQCLCGLCHTRKTRIEVGHKPLTPKRQQWRDMQRNPVTHKENDHADI
ncbi:HNH endonuclease signature motif containing protein [uncultured Algimonas sp.]|uniref:HNH endonuclease n=1 Tax=uncultured Algimonas sp. TaxID=1547920 RepID=UPI002611D2B4|nr:HNH endonuclease signature motif containing protein [uncultured Algimonas sp.]